MKIIFICNCLEPGRSGVGDYIRRIGSELVRQQHDIKIISLNDSFISIVTNGVQNDEGVNIHVLRLPAVLDMTLRLNVAKQYIDEFNPDWLSLQYVIFGFDPKGLPFGLSKKLAILGQGRKWHVMIHELWVGMAIEESKKLLLWGFIQRMLIKSLLLNLHAKIIHTQNPLYQAQLSKLGFNSGYLPLFGNLSRESDIKVRLAEDSLLIEKEISFVVFGSIHSGAPIKEFATEAAAYARKKNISIVLIFLGRCGPEQDRWAEAWESEGLSVKIIGEQPPADISQVLINSTLGISATAIAVIEKSSAYATMRDHGLSVISVAKSWQPRGMPKQEIKPGIIEYHIGNFEKCIKNNKYIPYNNNVSDVSIKLVEDLLKAH